MVEKDIQIFKQAIINEVEGYEFYKMAAYSAENEVSKKTFLDLANEELKHIDWLKDALKKLSTDPQDQTTLALLENPPSPDIFKWDNVRIKQASMAVSVFGIGIEMERASVKFYEDAMNNTSFETAKKLFEVLAKWEKVHLEQFSAEYDHLIKDWWSDQGFAPF